VIRPRGPKRSIEALLAAWLFFLNAGMVSHGELFHFPTANRTLLENGGEERFFVGTVGKSWETGRFGCVRTEGRQMHEGIDIKCLQRDSKGEPIDPVMATADGTVAYINAKPALSNYGNYIILKHSIEGLEIFSTYAHLRSIQDGLQIGQRVKAGATIGTMGRTSNTRQQISKERAHVHFEINLFLNERFPAWYNKTFVTGRNDHGQWNGQNLVGLDPSLLLSAQNREGSQFSALRFLRNQTELCRVLVRDTRFPWLTRYTPLIKRNPLAEQQGVAAYEIALNYSGIPFQLIPRAPSEIGAGPKFKLLSVNENEFQKHS
jgi:peptidoglycan LD-endopeptidase LytH